MDILTYLHTCIAVRKLMRSKVISGWRARRAVFFHELHVLPNMTAQVSNESIQNHQLYYTHNVTTAGDDLDVIRADVRLIILVFTSSI